MTLVSFYDFSNFQFLIFAVSFYTFFFSDAGKYIRNLFLFDVLLTYLFDFASSLMNRCFASFFVVFNAFSIIESDVLV